MNDNVTTLPAGQQEDEHRHLPDELLDQKNKDFFCKQIDALNKITSQRKEMNDRKAAVISAMADKGLDRHGVKRFMQYLAMDEDKRHQSDLTFQYLCRIHNIMLQDDLFAAEVQEQVARHQAGS